MSKKMIKPDSFVVGDVWGMLAVDHYSIYKGNTFQVTYVSGGGNADAGVDNICWNRIANNHVKLISRVGCVVVDGMIVGEEESIAPQLRSEAEVVKEWIGKLMWLANIPYIGIPSKIVVYTEHNDTLMNEECVEYVMNSYTVYQQKESEKKKQELLDKKAQLEVELSQINRELGE